MSTVSIIIPAYNCAAFLRQAIESALSQTISDKEIIVVDDGSTDQTAEIAGSFEPQGVKLIRQTNSGASAARNRGLCEASGKYIQFLDGDDWLHPNKIEHQLARKITENEVAFCRTVFCGDDAQHQTVDDPRFYARYLEDPIRFLIQLYGGFDYRSSMIQPNAFLVPRKLLDRVGGWNERLSLDDDGEFFCRVILAADRLIYVPNLHNFYRRNSSGTSLSARKSLPALESQFLSTRLKRQHLLEKNRDAALELYINTAALKEIRLLLFEIYPRHKQLYDRAFLFAKELRKHSSQGREVYGGSVSNFIGNHISWKLLRRLQHLRSSISGRSDNYKLLSLQSIRDEKNPYAVSKSDISNGLI